MAVIVDSSVWIDALVGETFHDIEDAMTAGTLYLAPLVIAELLSGELTPTQRESIFLMFAGVSALRRAIGPLDGSGRLTKGSPRQRR